VARLTGRCRSFVAALLLFGAAAAACSGGGGSPKAAPATNRPTSSAATTTSLPPSCAAGRGSLSYRPVPAGKGSLRVAVYLPPCAQGDPARHYPTIYLLHGGGTDETQWPAIGLAGTADRLIADHDIPPVIVVMPSAGLDTGDSSVADDVVPWADANLPTSATQRDRAIGGISLGGRAALSIVATHPTLFSRVGGHSPTVPSDALLSRLATWGGPVWLDVGNADGLLGSTEGLAGTLRADGIHPELHVYPGRHDRAYWGVHVADYLRFYAAAWRAP
jgi:enterochelin esterase-like enzyme